MQMRSHRAGVKSRESKSGNDTTNGTHTNKASDEPYEMHLTTRENMDL